MILDDGNIRERLIYINGLRIEVNNSKELFVGKKIMKYLRLVSSLKLITVVKELFHDTYAYLCKKNNHHKIIDFQKRYISGNHKIVVYTCIYGNCDTVFEPLCIDTGCEYYIFTDQQIKEDSVWKKMDDGLIPKECNTAQLKNRYVKMFPHRFFDCDYSIYIDGNLQIVGNMPTLVQNEISVCKTGMCMHISPRENCIYEEAKTVFHVGRITKEERDIVLRMYKKSSMPRHFGMYECNVIVRDHNNEAMKLIMEKWWSLYKNGVKRDQLYFTYVLYILGYKFDDLVNFGASVNLNPLFIRFDHIGNLIDKDI